MYNLHRATGWFLTQITGVSQLDARNDEGRGDVIFVRKRIVIIAGVVVGVLILLLIGYSFRGKPEEAPRQTPEQRKVTKKTSKQQKLSEEEINKRLEELRKKRQESTGTPSESAALEWTRLTKFEGTADKKTNQFRITGSQWELDITALGKKGADFRCFVCQVKDNKVVREIRLGQASSASDVFNKKVSLEKTGDFYLKIEAAQCRWFVYVNELTDKEKIE